MSSLDYSRQGGKVEIPDGKGNIYTFPAPYSCDKGMGIVFYSNLRPAKDSDVTWLTELHGQTYSLDQLDMNMIKIGNSTNSLKTCFHNLEWDKVGVLIPDNVITIKNTSNTYLAYTVVYEESVPRQVWDQALRIKEVFPDFLPVDYVKEHYGYSRQSVISEINNFSMQVVNSTTLMGVYHPKMVMSGTRKSIYCYSQGKVIEHNSPFYSLNSSNLSVDWVFTPEEGEHFSDFEEVLNGRYLIFVGYTKNHGYIGYENPIIVVFDTSEKKQYRWYYSQPQKGSFDIIQVFSKEFCIIQSNKGHEIIDYNQFLSRIIPGYSFTSSEQRKTIHGSNNGHRWVDLGLSVKWATCNVGAINPQDNGNYYAWGETDTKDSFSWYSYKHSEYKSGITKYNTSVNFDA